MKKRYGLAVAAALLSFCLAGCGNGAQEKQENTQISVDFAETERKTPAIGTKGSLMSASDGSVLFLRCEGQYVSVK